MNATLQTTVIRKIKRSKVFARWAAYEFERDDFGLWLFTPPGSLFRANVGGKIRECEVGQGNLPAGLPVLHLIPWSGWWMAQWMDEAQGAFISVEICTPPTYINDEWQFIDLELDPYQSPDGRVVIDDEDEFATACENGLISPEVATAARAAAVEVAGWLDAGIKPFGQMGWTKLNDAINLGLAPLRWLPNIATE